MIDIYYPTMNETLSFKQTNLSATMLSHTCLLLILLLAGIAADTSTSTNDIPTAQLLAKADGLLSSGRVTEALDMYGQAVDREPSSFVGRDWTDTSRDVFSTK